MDRQFSVVTTFNASGYKLYGSKMIDTFLVNWPKNVSLTVYAEDCPVVQTASNLTVLDFNQSLPAAVAFKQKWQSDARASGRLATGPADSKGKQPGIGFKWDAVRFCHKVYAVCDHARHNLDKTVLWMDADMVCHSPIDHPTLCEMIPDDFALAFLGRQGKYTECGLYALDMRDRITQHFVTLFQNAYDEPEFGIFAMEEWHDSFVFDQLRRLVGAANPAWKQLDWSRGLVTGEGHPLINSGWGAYLDHLKGKRKNTGMSLAKDIKTDRPEAYWRSLRAS
jgi:hypothetical protein